MQQHERGGIYLDLENLMLCLLLACCIAGRSGLSRAKRYFLCSAVAKRPRSPIAPPSNVLRTSCGSHEMLDNFWLGLSCFNTSGLCFKNM
eukprot:8883706-Pyramimonas_sp.AAC.1